MNDLLTYFSRVLFILLFGLTASSIPLAGDAQTWPEKPVKIVVPAPGGAAAEVIARLISDKLQARIGQPVVVDTKPGADGGIAAVNKIKRLRRHSCQNSLPHRFHTLLKI